MLTSVGFSATPSVDNFSLFSNVLNEILILIIAPLKVPCGVFDHSSTMELYFHVHMVDEVKVSHCSTVVQEAVMCQDM